MSSRIRRLALLAAPLVLGGAVLAAEPAPAPRAEGQRVLAATAPAELDQKIMAEVKDRPHIMSNLQQEARRLIGLSVRRPVSASAALPCRP